MLERCSPHSHSPDPSTCRSLACLLARSLARTHVHPHHPASGSACTKRSFNPCDLMNEGCLSCMEERSEDGIDVEKDQQVPLRRCGTRSRRGPKAGRATSTMTMTTGPNTLRYTPFHSILALAIFRPLRTGVSCFAPSVVVSRFVSRPGRVSVYNHSSAQLEYLLRLRWLQQPRLLSLELPARQSAPKVQLPPLPPRPPPRYQIRPSSSPKSAHPYSI